LDGSSGQVLKKWRSLQVALSSKVFKSGMLYLLCAAVPVALTTQADICASEAEAVVIATLSLS